MTRILSREEKAKITEELWPAIDQNNISKLKELIERGFNVKMKSDEDNFTILHWAESPEQTKLFIEAGADIYVNQQNYQGNTPLHWAKSVEQTEILIKAGANVNIQNIYNSTPLHCAKTEEQTRLLLESGAKITLNKFGQTPLHFANTVEQIKLLIDAGADLNVKDIYGKTAKDFHKNNNECLKFIEEEEKKVEEEKKRVEEIQKLIKIKESVENLKKETFSKEEVITLLMKN